MNCLVFISVIIFFASISAQEQEFTFSQETEILEKCIEDYLSRDPHLKSVKRVNSLARMIAKRFSCKSFLRKSFKKATETMYYYIRSQKSDLFTNNLVPGELRMSLAVALENCVERRNLPRFDNEFKVLADFLDIVLVDWPTPLDEMISTQEGRSTLRLYAYSAGERLMATLRYFSMDYDVFNRELQRIWMLRAQQYYDGRGNEIQYIRHRFTSDRDRMYSSIPLQDVHTIDDVNIYIPRRFENLRDRDSFFDLSKTDQILKIPEAGSSRQRNGNLPVIVSLRISGAEYYLQTHIVRCYKIILFILELQLRGINTDEDDIYDGPIPHDVMPLRIQEIAWSGEAYQNYLSVWSKHLQRYSNEKIEECYSREDLIMLLSLLIINKNSRPTTITTSTTTARTTTSTESAWHDDGSKKGGVRDRDCGKYFLPKKQLRTMFSQPNQEAGQKNDDFSYYGYAMFNGIRKGLEKSDDQSVYLKIFAELSLVVEGIIKNS